MYLRFVTPLIHPHSRVESGFFRASWYVYQNNCPDWIRQELSDQFSWFGQHLPIPGRIARHFKRRDTIWGICWFDPQAREAVSRARYCAWLLEEGGLPVRAITVSGQRGDLARCAPDRHQAVGRPAQGIFLSMRRLKTRKPAATPAFVFGGTARATNSAVVPANAGTTS